MNETFAERLKEIRESKEWTQQQFADAIGCSRATYNHYENGNRHPDDVILRKLCQKASVSADYLLGLSSTKNVSLSRASDVTGFSEKALEYLQVEKKHRKFAADEPGIVNKVLDFIILDADFNDIFDHTNPNHFSPESESLGMLPKLPPSQIRDECPLHILDAVKNDWGEGTFVTAEEDPSLKEEEITASLEGESVLFQDSDYNPEDHISIDEIKSLRLLGIEEKDYLSKQEKFLIKELGKSYFLDALMKYLLFDKNDVYLCSNIGCSKLSENRDLTIRLGNTSIRFPSEEGSQLIETKLLQDVIDALKKLKQNFEKETD